MKEQIVPKEEGSVDEEKVRHILEVHKNNIAPASMKSFAERVSAAPDSAYEPLMNAKLKSKTAAILLSVFLGGVAAGRFYVGNVKYGIVKIAVTILLGLFGVGLSYFLAMMAASGGGDVLRQVWPVIIADIVIAIWWLAEIFLCPEQVLKVNTQTLFRILNSY